MATKAEQGDNVYPLQDMPSEDHSLNTEKAHEKNPAQVHDVVVEQLHEIVDKIDDNELAPVDDLAMVKDKIDVLTVEQSKAIIDQLLEDHKYDYNFATAQKEKLVALASGPTEGQDVQTWEFELKAEAAICKFYSPYPEVRSVATPVDDPSILCETIRAHILGYAWACIGQFINSLFNSRLPAISFTSPIAQIFLYPCGKICAWALPDWGFTLFGTRHSLNPGPWTYKEQMFSTIIINVAIGSAYVFWNIQTQTVYYKETWLTAGYEIMLLLSTQLMGFGFAGMLRRFVVYPTQTFWPSILPTLALNRALLIDEKQNELIHGWRMSRYKFFFIVFGAMCVYFWIPDFLFAGLSYFSWICWIAPNNFKLAVVTGSQLGMGFNPWPTWDWNVLATYWAPLIYPTFAYVQQYAGLMIGSFAVLAIYFTNTKWTGYLPPNASGIFDNTGSSFNSSRVLVNGKLDEAAYQAYSPAFYSAGNLVVYSSFFAYYPLTFCFIILDQWRQVGTGYRMLFTAGYNNTKKVVAGLKNASVCLFSGRASEAGGHLKDLFLGDGSSVYDGFDDPFTQMARAYPEVPDWWFLFVMAVSFVFSIIVLTQYPLGVPVWTIFFVLGLNATFLVPMTFLYAISGTTEGLNIITELVVGYALPGNPNALMFVKAFGYNIGGQADNYVSDQKMGLYAKLPPRAMFRGQLIASILACFVCYGVVNWVDGFTGICTPGQAAKFNCENGSQIYYSSSVVWGLIGPKRIFDQIYPTMKYSFLFGFLLALAWWTTKRYGPSAREAMRSSLPSGLFSALNLAIFTPISWMRDVHPSLLFNGTLYLAPLNLSYATTGLYLNFIFMYWIRRNKTAWFEKYNYILTAALSAGVAFMAIIIFFAVQYHPVALEWWGNTIIETGVDGYAGQTALLTELPEAGFFGPATWS